MVTITITMNVRPTKRQELLQTFHELADVMRKEQGFIDFRTCIEAGNPQVVTLVEEWETQEDVEAYMQSEYFYVLRGAMKLLTSSWDITCTTISSKRIQMDSPVLFENIQEEWSHENTHTYSQTMAK